MSPGRTVEVRPAGTADLEVASEILVEAARWLEARGEPLWSPSDLTPEKLRAEAEAGELQLGWLRGEPVATLVLRFEDPLFWPEVPAGESGFVHRLAVRRRVAGTGVADAMLAWAADRARQAGCQFLRLDCSDRHPGLARYYEARGFARHSAGRLGEFGFLRYQKALGVDSPG